MLLDFIVHFARFQFIFAMPIVYWSRLEIARHLYWRYLYDFIALSSHSCAAHRLKCQRACPVECPTVFITTRENILFRYMDMVRVFVRATVGVRHRVVVRPMVLWSCRECPCP